jgi:hypothetical protein
MSRYALPLSGYDDASIWGYDELDSTYYAQLWRNGSDSWNEPDLWLNWFTASQPISSAARLATMIAARTGISAAEVFRSMAAAQSAPESGELLSLAESLSSSPSE